MNEIAEYGVDGVEWRVTQWKLMQAELPGIAVEDLPRLQEALTAKGNDRTWFIARHLFGMMPIMLGLDSDPDEGRPWSRAEIAGKLGLTDKQLAEELQALRMGWEKRGKKGAGVRSREAGYGKEKDGVKLPPSYSVLLEEDDMLLKRFGWSPTIFEKEGRDAQMNRDEKLWFAEQVRGWQKLLNNVKTSSPARQALNNALRLRREENASWELDRQKPPDDPKKRAEFEKAKDCISQRITECQAAHEKSLEILHEMAPGFGIDRSELPTTGAVGEIIKGVQEWEAREDRKLLDGIYNQYEIQVLLRTSLQMPLPAYRVGKVAYLLDSMSWMWSRGAKSRFKDSDFGILEPAFKEALRALKEKKGLHVPDLRMEGEEGEYDDLHLVEEMSGELK